MSRARAGPTSWRWCVRASGGLRGRSDIWVPFTIDSLLPACLGVGLSTTQQKDSKKVTVEGFKALAAKVMAEPDAELSYEEVEKLFWRKIGAWLDWAGWLAGFVLGGGGIGHLDVMYDVCAFHL